MVGRYVFENAGECAGLEGMMIGNDFVVLSVPLRSHSDVRTFLAGRLVSENA
jgi:hypothetical protein